MIRIQFCKQLELLISLQIFDNNRYLIHDCDYRRFDFV